jgi:hypothetical protein
VLLVVVAGVLRGVRLVVLLLGCRGSMELEGLSCHVRCSGNLGDRWAEEVLSLRS